MGLSWVTQQKITCLPMQESWLGRSFSLEKERATHTSIFTWEILYTEDPGGLQSMASWKSRHDLGTKQHILFPLRVTFHSIFCLYGITYFAHFKYMKSSHMWSFISCFFHLAQITSSLLQKSCFNWRKYKKPLAHSGMT